jgi:hypothetical protein
LRKLAQKYREMAAGDGDAALRSGLMLLADEFEHEAVITDTRSDCDRPEMPERSQTL